jgi:anti-anti-sigma factor
MQMSLLQITMTSKEEVVEITLAGVLRQDTVEQFRQELEKIAPSKPKRLVLHLRELTELGSAGLRILLAVKQQQMGAYVEVYVIAAQPQAMLVIEGCSLQYSFIFQDTYP